MQLLVLAAGHGRRYGGLKQLAPVGPLNECLMDYTAIAATECGIEDVVLVVREEIRHEVEGHVRRRWPSELVVEFAIQPDIPGTAQAVFSARSYIDDVFAVANADDLYGEGIIELQAAADGRAADAPHILMGYDLGRTVLTPETVTRGMVEIADDGHLVAIHEHKVARREDGRFDVRPLPSNEPVEIARFEHIEPGVREPETPVSMNLWAFQPRIFDALEHSISSFDPETAPRPELLLPDVVGHIVTTQVDRVEVRRTNSRCIGLTHPADLDIVRDEIALLETSTSARVGRFG